METNGTTQERQPIGALPWTYKERAGKGGDVHYVLQDAERRYIGDLVNEGLARMICAVVNARVAAVEAMETGIGTATGIKLLLSEDAGACEDGAYVSAEAVRAIRKSAGESINQLIIARDALGNGKPKRNGS